jgi:uncharacterized repeat protein (TIGR01451 family)
MQVTLPSGFDSVVDADGGSISGNTITWNLGILNLNTLYSGQASDTEQCVTRSIEISFPSGAYTDPKNTVSFGIDSSGTTNGSAWSESDIATAWLIPDCSTLSSGSPYADLAVMNISKGVSGSPTGNQFDYIFTLTHSQSSSGALSGAPIVNPVIVDLLPTGITFAGWVQESTPNGNPGANLEVIDNYEGSGRQLLRFTWGQTPPLGAFSYVNSPPGSNPFHWEFDDGMGSLIEVIKVNIGATVPPGSLSNTVYASMRDDFDCPGGFATGVPSILADQFSVGACDDRISTPTVPASYALAGKKYVKGAPSLLNIDDPNSTPAVADTECEGYPSSYTAHPCVAQTVNNGDFTYLLEFTNAGNANLDEYILYDELPRVGDIGVSPSGRSIPRLSEWQPTLTGAVTFDSANDYNNIPILPNTSFSIEYTTAATPCNELNSPGNPSSGCDATYSTLPADPSTVTGFRIYGWRDGNKFLPGHTYRFKVPMKAPLNAPVTPDPANGGDFHPAWNSFAHTADRQTTSAATHTYLTSAEPNKVGIIVKPGQDLVVNKTNDTNDSFVLSSGSFNWSINMTSIGGDDVTFAANQTILRDVLPTGVVYGTPSVIVNAGVTGIVNCSIASNVLTCIAAGGDVTMDGTIGNMDVVFSVTPSVEGSLVNPTGGLCRIDPDSNVSELNENNNDCSDTVVVSSTAAVTLVPLQVVKTLTGSAAPLDWEFTLSLAGSSPADCLTHVAPSLIVTAPAAGGNATTWQVPTNIGASACSYTITETAQAGYSLVTPAANMTNISVDGSGATVNVSNEQDCAITTANVVTACLDSGTTDPLDDVFTVTTNPLGNNLSGSYSVSGDITAAGVAYGSAQRVPDNSTTFPISNGNLTITLQDSASASCQLSNITISAPATCSGSTAVQPDLELSKEAYTISGIPVSGSLASGDRVVYRLVVKNLGTGSATGVVVSDPLPNELSYISDDASGSHDGSTAGGVVTWSIPTINPGETVTINLTVKIN